MSEEKNISFDIDKFTEFKPLNEQYQDAGVKILIGPRTRDTNIPTEVLVMKDDEVVTYMKMKTSDSHGVTWHEINEIFIDQFQQYVKLWPDGNEDILYRLQEIRTEDEQRTQDRIDRGVKGTEKA